MLDFPLPDPPAMPIIRGLFVGVVELVASPAADLADSVSTRSELIEGKEIEDEANNKKERLPRPSAAGFAVVVFFLCYSS
mmetsp:Transcript_16750/g.32600  ORF Transcript_16750/g.32600 Transcript_16750/m.32600 type:complete len:80 (+) Transcript_16750:1263-1502(+)